MIRKPRCRQRFRLFPTPKAKKKSRSAQKKMNDCRFLRENGPCRHHSSWWQTGSHCGLVCASLSPEDGTPWPFSSSWQCQCAHSSNNGGLSHSERGAAAAAPTVFARPLSLPLLPIPRSEETTEGYPVWGAPKMHVERSRGLLKTYPKPTWAEELSKCFHRMAKCIAAEGWLFEKMESFFCLVSPSGNEYPETFGASLVPVPCTLHLPPTNLPSPNH